VYALTDRHPEKALIFWYVAEHRSCAYFVFQGPDLTLTICAGVCLDGRVSIILFFICNFCKLFFVGFAHVQLAAVVRLRWLDVWFCSALHAAGRFALEYGRAFE